MAIFLLAVGLELIYILLFIATIKLPGFRFWPPPSWRSWQFFAAWILAIIVVSIGLFLGLLDFDSGFLPALENRLPIALAFFIVGTSLGTWSYLAFGFRTTLGLGPKLILSGPYRYTRNPQYIGDSLNAIAFMLLTNSWMVWIIAILGIILNWLAPFAEEPWLEEKFGDSYRTYKQSVPRFFGRIDKWVPPKSS